MGKKVALVGLTSVLVTVGPVVDYEADEYEIRTLGMAVDDFKARLPEPPEHLSPRQKWYMWRGFKCRIEATVTDDPNLAAMMLWSADEYEKAAES